MPSNVAYFVHREKKERHTDLVHNYEIAKRAADTGSTLADKVIPQDQVPSAAPALPTMFLFSLGICWGGVGQADHHKRSEECRVGKECVRTGKSRWSP